MGKLFDQSHKNNWEQYHEYVNLIAKTESPAFY